MSSPNPDELFQALLAQAAHPTKKRNLSALQQICEKQHKAGSLDFSVASVGRLMEAAGFIGAKTLNNPSSKNYRSLIAAWAVHAKPSAHRSVGGVDWLLRIPDPAVRTLVQAMQSELSRLRGEAVALRKLQRPITLYANGAAPCGDAGRVEVFDAPSKLTASERASLQRAIDPGYLGRQGLKTGEAGEISNLAGRVIFDPGFVSGLRKLLGAT